MKKCVYTCLFLVLLVGTAIICATKPAQAETLDIGVVTPLTGPPAHLGTNIKNSILLAIDDQNKQGGVTIAGKKYTLSAIIRDSKADNATGRSIAEELVFNKKVKIVAGPFLADAIGAQTVTEPNKVVLFAITCDIPGLSTPEKPYSFFLSGGGEECTINPAAYVQKFYPGLKTVATLNPDLPSLPNWVYTAPAISSHTWEIGFRLYTPSLVDWVNRGSV